jgi:hypothetical protein
MSRIFQSRFHFFGCFSRGDCLDGDLKRLDVYETVHVVFPGEPRPFRCCSSRAKLLVMPIYKVPYGALARM